MVIDKFEAIIELQCGVSSTLVRKKKKNLFISVYVDLDLDESEKWINADTRI